jgi:hypothetical protein
MLGLPYTYKSVGIAGAQIDDTSTGKLMEGVLAAFAQFDNDCRSHQTNASWNHLASWLKRFDALRVAAWALAGVSDSPERRSYNQRRF